MGTFVALLPNRRTVLAFAGTQQPATVTELGTMLAPSASRGVALKEGHD